MLQCPHCGPSLRRTAGRALCRRSGANLTFERELVAAGTQMSNSKSQGLIKLLVILMIPAFALDRAASGCKCRNRGASVPSPNCRRVYRTLLRQFGDKGTLAE